MHITFKTWNIKVLKMVYFILMKLNISNIVHIINWQTQPLYFKLETNNKQLNFS
jgi:hypothetical protein